MKLYSYHRSSAAFRVRIALNLKGLDFETIPVHLVRNNGEQNSASYLEKNPQGLVPTLELNESGDHATQYLSQSLAIIEYLDETFPSVPLLAEQAIQRAEIRSVALSIATDIHPLNNLRVLRYVSNILEASDEQKNQWYKHWIEQGFSALETTLQQSSNGAGFCFGDRPTLADCCLIPQVYNALRFNCDVDKFESITRINQHCLQLPAFYNALPENQPDADQ